MSGGVRSHMVRVAVVPSTRETCEGVVLWLKMRKCARFPSGPVSISAETLNAGGKYNAKGENGGRGRKRRGHGITGKTGRGVAGALCDDGRARLSWRPVVPSV